MNQRVTVIIVTWNSENEISDCLSTLQNDIDSELAHAIVIDNTSTDGTVGLIRDQFPWCELIVNPINTGFAAANNVAIRRATSEFIMLLNPDTELHPGVLAKMVRFLDEHPSVGVVGPRVYMDDGRIQPTILRYPSLVGSLFGFTRYLRTSSANVTPVVDDGNHLLVDAVSGACMLIRKEVMDQVGMMDEEYFLAAEEVDLCYRIKSAGWDIAYYAGAEILHYGGRSMAKASLKSFVEKRRGRILFILQHRGKMEARMEMHLIELLIWGRSILKRNDRQYYREALILFKQRTHPLFKNDNS